MRMTLRREATRGREMMISTSRMNTDLSILSTMRTKDISTRTMRSLRMKR